MPRAFGPLARSSLPLREPRRGVLGRGTAALSGSPRDRPAAGRPPRSRSRSPGGGTPGTTGKSPGTGDRGIHRAEGGEWPAVEANGPRARPRKGPAFDLTDRPKRERAEAIAAVLDHRIKSAAWWRAVATVFPGGVCSTRSAAAFLAVSPTRIRALIKQGRLPTVGPAPGDGDTYIPVDALMGAASPREGGRPRGWARGQAALMAEGTGSNAYMFSLRRLGISPQITIPGDESGEGPPKVPKCLS